jgi:tetratricopeptide (TPR) repeat protein
LQFVKEKALEEDDKKLSQRAAYNEAIAHLHNYTYEKVDTSVKLLEKLIDSITDDCGQSPLKAMACAAQACVTAHLPLFWKEVEPKLPETMTEGEIRNHKKERQHYLLTWQQQVKTITDTLNAIEEKISKDITDASNNGPRKRKFDKWDRSDCRRLQLAIHDAWAHFYLNCAVEFLDGPTPDFGAGFSQKHFLDLAREEFRQCELLQPPEVENRADIGTLYLFLGEYETARRYLEDAVKLKNETYEYAFLRLAQTYEKEKKFDLVVKTLKRFKGPRRLIEFKAMCEKYLPSPPGRMEKLKIWYPLGEPDATN